MTAYCLEPADERGVRVVHVVETSDAVCADGETTTADESLPAWVRDPKLSDGCYDATTQERLA